MYERSRNVNENKGSSLPSWKGIAVILALTFAVFAPTLRYQFVHDDRGQIVENPAIHSWRFVPTYFTSHVWAAVMPAELGNYYRPLFLVWLRINDALFGSHAWGWHLTTILAHVLATFLVYLLALRLGVSGDAALVTALIFGLHPAHVEAVAWISGVTEPLLGVLLVASFLSYTQWRRERARRWKLLSLALFTLALGEKETALILPGLLLVYDWIFETSSVGIAPVNPRGIVARSGAALRRTWPFFLLVILYVPARIYALKGFSHAVTPLSIEQSVFTWPSLICFWIRHLIWPYSLSTFYNFPAVVHPTLENFVLPAIFDACVGGALLVAVRRSRMAAFSAAWMVLPLVPLLDLRVFVADDFAHDRYLYLPSVGFAILVALILKKVCPGTPQWRGVPASMLAAALCLAALMSLALVKQSFYFRDNLAFYAYNNSTAPHNPAAESNYATILAEGGSYGPALEKFQDVVSRNPNYWSATYNLALTYYKMGNLPEAEKYFLEAVRINPHKADEHLYLGMTWFKSGRTDEAIASLRRAIAINSSGFAYHFALGVMLKSRGDLNGALLEFKKELTINPDQHAAAAQIKEIENGRRGLGRE
jgi:tetratricopeptide (TPR) repeat protein